MDLTPRTKGLLVAGLAAGVLLVSVAARSAQGFPPCAFRLVTGIPCASCGMTRAFLDLGHGRFGSALHHNLAAPLVYACTAALLVLGLLQAWRNRETIAPAWRRAKPVLLPVLIGAAMVNWVVALKAHFIP